MSKLVLAARVLLGVIFILFGLNYFVPFIPVPPPTPEGGAFLGALFQTGYMFPLIKVTEIVGGALVLLGFVPIGLILLAPIAVNIFAYHFILDPSGLALPVVIVGLMLFLGWRLWPRFAPLFNKGG